MQPNPIAFEIFGFEIRWYGILIAIGIALAIITAYRRSSAVGIKSDDLLDAVIISVPIGIIGARAYYVFFSLDNYHSFAQMIDIRSGGLAIHGGIIFGLATAYLVCKKKKIQFFNLFDLAVPSIALAQSIGRWGNYFNSEAHGGETNLPWAIMVDGKSVHPTFLYESIWCFVLFIGLSYLLLKKRQFTGQIFSLYVILYSVERFFVEGLRTDSLMIGPFRQAQVLSLVLIAVGVVVYVYGKRKCVLSNDNK
ncbi:MAG: prolipoprotein diacylglyceryl transferase [Eubacteriales bacterium]|nr:prolipoprotein diacylglyceryl transferase [Eubacteriales bacterium]MDY3332831.1 prolipoprotein diacylglyceryl transferase [Gallibacter sp.]